MDIDFNYVKKIKRENLELKKENQKLLELSEGFASVVKDYESMVQGIVIDDNDTINAVENCNFMSSVAILLICGGNAIIDLFLIHLLDDEDVKNKVLEYIESNIPSMAKDYLQVKIQRIATEKDVIKNIANATLEKYTDYDFIGALSNFINLN